MVFRVSLNSRDFDLGTRSRPTFLFKKSTAKYVERFKVESASIPQTFFFVSGNIHWESTGSGGAQTQALTTQNYTGAQLASHLQTLLQVHDATATVTYSSQTQKLTFTAVGMEVFADSTAGKYFGIGDVDLGPSASIEMTNVIYVRPRCLYIHSSFGNTKGNIYKKNLNSSNIATIPSNVVMGQQLTWQNIMINDWYKKGDKLRDMSFSITADDDATYLDFNGLGYCINLICE